MKKNLCTGTVIKSEKFAYGYFEHEGDTIITVDGKTKERPVQFCINEEERVTIAIETKRRPPKYRVVELSKYDPSRAEAQFVIELAYKEQGDDDYYRNGRWYIQARRLNDNKTYNPDAEFIQFYMDVSEGRRDCPFQQNDIHVTGKMQIMFVQVAE